jgi:hypothetical protein
VLIGTGLTAIDALLSLRAGGFTGPVIAASRTGLLPRPHVRDTPTTTLSEDDAAAFDCVSSILRFVRAAAIDGDWRGPMDALRPHTSAIWQRLSQRQQASVARRWSTWWSVHRHRMAPENAAMIDAELGAGTRRVLAIASLDATNAPGGALEVTLTHRGGRASASAPPRSSTAPARSPTSQTAASRCYASSSATESSPPTTPGSASSPTSTTRSPTVSTRSAACSSASSGSRSPCPNYASRPRSSPGRCSQDAPRSHTPEPRWRR